MTGIHDHYLANDNYRMALAGKKKKRKIFPTFPISKMFKKKVCRNWLNMALSLSPQKGTIVESIIRTHPLMHEAEEINQ